MLLTAPAKNVVARLLLVLAEGGLGCIWTRGWSGFRSKKSAFKSSDSSHLVDMVLKNLNIVYRQPETDCVLAL